MCIAPPLSVLNSYTVVMDATHGPNTSNSDLHLDLVDNPVATLIREKSRRVDLGVNGPTININVSTVFILIIMTKFLVSGTAYH